MSALLHVLESSIVRALLQHSTADTTSAVSFSVLTEATAISVANYGIHYESSAGSFTLNFYTSLSQQEQQTPCITVVCTDAQAYDSGIPWIKRMQVVVQLRIPGDNSTENADVPLSIRGIGMWLDSIFMMKAGLIDMLNNADHNIAVSHAALNSTNRAVVTDKRLQVLEWTLDVVAALKP